MSTTIKVCPVCSVSWYADKPEKHMMTCTAAAAAPPPWMVEPGKYSGGAKKKPWEK
jgi:hypothetical protein